MWVAGARLTDRVHITTEGLTPPALPTKSPVRTPSCAIAPRFFTQNHALAHVQRLKRRQRNGNFDKNALVIASPDPDGSFIGSGGATMNAMLHVTEHLSARAGATFVDSAVLVGKHVIIMHVDGESRRMPLFSSSAASFDGTAVEHMLANMTKLREASDSPPGTWICSVEAVISFRSDAVPALDFSRDGFTAFSPSVPIAEVAETHGAYKVRCSDMRVMDWGYKLSADEVVERGFTVDGSADSVHMACGVVYASLRATQFLVDSHIIRPFDQCTYLGHDDGGTALSFSLFNDLFKVLAEDAVEPPSEQMTLRELWNRFRVAGKFAVHVTAPPPATISYAYRRNTRECIADDIVRAHQSGWIETGVIRVAAAEVEGQGVVNTLLCGNGTLHSGSIVEHSHLDGDWFVGEGSFISGVTLDAETPLAIPSRTVLQCIPLADRSGSDSGAGNHIYITCGVDDELAGGNFGNVPFAEALFAANSGIEPRDVWPAGTKQDLFHAKLFVSVQSAEDAGIDVFPMWLLPCSVRPPSDVLERWRFAQRLSIADVTRLVDMTALYSARENIATTVGSSIARAALIERKDDDLLPFYRWCASHEQWGALPVLDKVAAEAKGEDVAARAMAHIADLLACFASNSGGLRSGPAHNKAWAPALAKLRKGKRSQAVVMMAKVRSAWVDTPTNLIRAARHYEGAGAILVRQAVESCREFIVHNETARVPIGQCVFAEAAARIDLAGGWTDTPPITFECGGVVTNVAVLVDGMRPIGASVRS